MDFASVILFLVIYYVRPQEWVEGLEGARPVLLVMIFAIGCMVFRDRELRIKDFFRTPHDWVMFAFFAWLIFVSPPWLETSQAVKNRLMFYVVTLQALSSLDRLERFLRWWVVMLAFVVFMALAGEYGWDPTGAYELTHGRMEGRLVLNMSIFNNPNALGHSVVPLLPMIYYLLIWHRWLVAKEIGLVCVSCSLWCMYLTQSKGSYLSGAATLISSLAFGRPRHIQIAIAILALMFGGMALRALPRMEAMAAPRKEEGIMGRLFAFNYGLDVVKKRTRGVGYDRFTASIARERGRRIASHSAYVQVGAELGKTGLFLYLGVLYCCLRTLVTAKCATDQEERVRRLLVAAIIGFMASGWMVNFTYRATFFFQAACVAAFHRHLLRIDQRPKGGDDGQTVVRRSSGDGGEEEGGAGDRRLSDGVSAVASAEADGQTMGKRLSDGGEEVLARPQAIGRQRSDDGGGGGGQAAVTGPPEGRQTVHTPASGAGGEGEGDAPAERGTVWKDWSRLRWVDFVLMYGMLGVTLWFWRYVVHNL